MYIQDQPQDSYNGEYVRYSLSQNSEMALKCGTAGIGEIVDGGIIKHTLDPRDRDLIKLPDHKRIDCSVAAES